MTKPPPREIGGGFCLGRARALGRTRTSTEPGLSRMPLPDWATRAPDRQDSNLDLPGFNRVRFLLRYSRVGGRRGNVLSSLAPPSVQGGPPLTHVGGGTLYPHPAVGVLKWPEPRVAGWAPEPPAARTTSPSPTGLVVATPSGHLEVGPLTLEP